MQKVLYEAESGSESVRHRKHADMGAKPLTEFIADLRGMADLKVASG